MKVHEVEEKITTRIAGLEQQETRLQAWLDCLRQVGEIAEKHGYNRPPSQAEEGSLMQAFEELVDQAEPDDAPERETSRLYRDETQNEVEDQHDEESYSDKEPSWDAGSEAELTNQYDPEEPVEEVYLEPGSATEDVVDVLESEEELVRETLYEDYEKAGESLLPGEQDEEFMSGADESEMEEDTRTEMPDETSLDELRSQLNNSSEKKKKKKGFGSFMTSILSSEED